MKGYKINIKTKERELVEDNTPLPEGPVPEEPKGLNFEKLKEILLKKGIIASKKEVE